MNPIQHLQSQKSQLQLQLVHVINKFHKDNPGIGVRVSIEPQYATHQLNGSKELTQHGVSVEIVI